MRTHLAGERITPLLPDTPVRSLRIVRLPMEFCRSGLPFCATPSYVIGMGLVVMA